MELYQRLVPWYRLLTPPSEYAEEASCYRAAFERAVPDARTLLELGAGAGHNAYHLKQRFACTLTDIADEMLDLSRALNPACEHLPGDMRTLRLERQFDLVFVHDAVGYMRTPEELAAAIGTAFAHTRPGGAALFAPDHLRETFTETTHVHEGGDAQRALRCMEWTWDPDPEDTECVVDFVFALRENGRTEVVHDQHRVGLFARATWQKLLSQAGYQVEIVARPLTEEYSDEIFLCRRPAA
ncbi:class I SAM-dependent methyltransferase [Haliangium ochraceum]|uniref:Methyltransferase type 11 n=1 Tax=Haliangium ochraceum (strain DSM 14365 / JCM 11303 / SMP-2) TaxID=502025 RepID=D0LI14_HALO1|nr:class I SAM-dependent methyltransferase [Haliangium ochraceum]ACY14843.1 Methyltransferase type 11 [Haliangium ochraceum DSM 14365]